MRQKYKTKIESADFTGSLMLVAGVPKEIKKVENDPFFPLTSVSNLFEVLFMVSAPNIHLWSFPGGACLLLEYKASFPEGRMLGY